MIDIQEYLASMSTHTWKSFVLLVFLGGLKKEGQGTGLAEEVRATRISSGTKSLRKGGERAFGRSIAPGLPLNSGSSRKEQEIQTATVYIFDSNKWIPLPPPKKKPIIVIACC